MLTETEKQQIRLWLGYPSAWRFRHTRLESILEATVPEAEVQLRSCLESLTAVEASLFTGSMDSAGIKRVDEVEFFASSARRLELQALGKQYVGRISIILGVPVYSDAFGKSGYLGDSFTPGFGQGGGRGGPIRLG